MATPTKFYKYTTAKTARPILEKSALQWSSPTVFNDPFDMQFDLQPGIQAKVAGVPILDCHYGTSNGKYALKIDQLLTSSNLSWMGAHNAA